LNSITSNEHNRKKKVAAKKEIISSSLMNSQITHTNFVSTYLYKFHNRRNARQGKALAPVPLGAANTKKESNK
jgi:hypothetical protein